MAWNNKYKQEDLRLIPAKAILSDFGKAIDVEDIVELHIFSSDGVNKLFSVPDITSFKIAEGGILDNGAINNDPVIFLDLHNDIRNYVSAGTFIVKYNFFRTILGSNNQGINDLFVDEISTSRREIRLKISPDASQIEKEIFEDFADKLSIKGSVEHWVDIHVNFGDGLAPLVVNWSIDKLTTPEFPYSIVLKLYDPLPVEIKAKQPCWIVQELVTPVQETVYVESPEIEKQVNLLSGPNFSVGSQEGYGPGTSNFYNWSTLTDAKEDVVDKVLNRYFSSSLDNVRLNIDYRRYAHFVRFGSATERLKNYQYKLSQLEFYDAKIADISHEALHEQGNSEIANSYHHLKNVQNFKTQKNNIISKFDGYEKFLHEESASYQSSSLGEFYPSTWPKVSTTAFPKSPYTNISVTSSQAIDWFTGAISSASLYDSMNIHSLQNTAIPLHIHEDPTLGTDENINGEYVKFVHMVGEFFDNIYLYVTAIPETWDRHNAIDAKLIEGQFSGSDMLSKDLIYMGLKSLGYSQCLKSNEQDLWTYVIGTDNSGSYGDKTEYFDTNDWSFWQAPDDQYASGSYILGTSEFSQSRVYASDYYQTSHSLARENVRLEFGKRLLNNLPHLMKTKGTKENLHAYMNIYGIPRTLFRIKEWGGTVPVDYFTNEYFEYDTYNYGLNFIGSSNITASWDEVVDPTIMLDNGNRSQFPDTIEFRFKLPDLKQFNLKCGKMQFQESNNNANKKDMVMVQINSSSFIAVEHASTITESVSFSTADDSKYGRVKFALKTSGSGNSEYFESTVTDWAPIYDGDWWNTMVRRNSPTATTVTSSLTENFTYDVFCQKSTDWSRATISHAVSASLSTDGSTVKGLHANASWNSDGYIDTQWVSSSFLSPENANFSDDGYTEGTYGTNYDSFFIGGAVNSANWSINNVTSSNEQDGSEKTNYFNFSGSLQEFRFWMKPLSQSAFNNHTINPMAIDGNTYTSSFHDLIARYSLGADLKTYALGDGSIIDSSHPNQNIIRPYQANRSTHITASGFNGTVDFIESYERVATIVPNSIGLNTGQDKIRIQENTLDGNLSYNKKAEIPSGHPNDVNRVSIQLTPVDQINIDMEHQLGGIDFNDLVGDPRAKYKSSYSDVVFYNNHYWLKHFGPFKYSEFFKMIRYYDDTVLCQMKKNVPGRSKPDFNITIEPHILERPRIPERNPSLDHVQLEGSASARVYLNGNTTELGRFKHNGPGDSFYSDWNNIGPEESRYGDLISPNPNSGNRNQAHQLPQLYPSYGTGGQRERENNPAGLFRTTVGELEATINNKPFEPIIKDDISMCWERDQHEGAARYEWHSPVNWSTTKGDYKDYSVSGTTSVSQTKAATEISLAGTFPNAGLETYSSTSIILTATNGTVATFLCHDSGSPDEGSTASQGSNIAGSVFLYNSNPAQLAANIKTAINGHVLFDVGTVATDGTVLDSAGSQVTKYIIPITQKTPGANGNTNMLGTFFPPYTGLQANIQAAHTVGRSFVFPGLNGFSGGITAHTVPAITSISDSTRTRVTQANAYWERDVLMNVSHPMDPRADEVFYDFNKNEYLPTNLHPNKPMFDRTRNYPILNNGLTSYADNKSCRDRGKEFFYPFIGNQRESFYKYTELHRFATELSQSLGKKIPRVQYGQSDIGYGNLNGQLIVSHSGAQIQNLNGISILSRSAQYQDYRSKGLQNLIYDGCMMSASDFNVDSNQTIDGGPVVEIIDTTPFTITSAPPTLGEGPGRVSGEGIGRGVGKYSGRPIGRAPAAGRGQVSSGGRYNYQKTSNDAPRRNQS